jgi:uncharacterized protein YegL
MFWAARGKPGLDIRTPVKTAGPEKNKLFMLRRSGALALLILFLSFPAPAQDRPPGPTMVDFGTVTLKGASGTASLGKLVLPPDLLRLEVFLSEEINFNRGPSYSLRPFLSCRGLRVDCFEGRDNSYNFFSGFSGEYSDHREWLNEAFPGKSCGTADCGFDWNAGEGAGKAPSREGKVLAGAVLHTRGTSPISPVFPLGLTSFPPLNRPQEPFGFFNRDYSEVVGGGTAYPGDRQVLAARRTFLRTVVSYLEPGFWRGNPGMKAEILLDGILTKLGAMVSGIYRAASLPEYESLIYLCSRRFRDSGSRKGEEMAALVERTRARAEMEFFALSEKLSPGETLESYFKALEKKDYLEAAKECLRLEKFSQCWHYAAFDPRASDSLYLSAGLDVLLSLLNEAFQAERRALPAGSDSPPALIPGFTEGTSSASVLVVDVSGSMREELGGRRKLALAKNASLMMLDVLSRGGKADNSRHSLAVVSFSVPALVEKDLTCDYEAVKSAIRKIPLGSNTNVGGGLTRALQVLERVPARVRDKSIILLSDGMPNTGMTREEILSVIPRRAREKKIRIFTVGFKATSDYDEKFMQALAREGGGDYYYVEEADTLGDKLLRIRHSASGRIVAVFSGALFPGIASGPHLFNVPPGTETAAVTIHAREGPVPLFTLEDPRGRILTSPDPSLTVMRGNPLFLLVKKPAAGEWKLSLSGAGDRKPPFFHETIISVRPAPPPAKEHRWRIFWVLLPVVLLPVLLWRRQGRERKTTGLE